MKNHLARRSILVLILASLLATAGILAATGDKTSGATAPATLPASTSTPSALETNPAGWIDLIEGATLDGWTRVSIPAGPLSEKNPWGLDGANHTLVCDGVGVHEMLLFKKPFADGIFHVEWRFRKIELSIFFSICQYLD